MRRFLPATAIALLPFAAVAVEGGPAASALVPGSQTTGQTTGSAGENDGWELIDENCLACHDDSYIVSAHLTREQWEEVIDMMFGMGMPSLEPDVQTKILDYLEEAHGPRKASGSGNNAAAPGSSDAEAEELPWAFPRYRANPLYWRER